MTSLFYVSIMVAIATMLCTLAVRFNLTMGETMIDLSHPHDGKMFMSVDNPPYIAKVLEDGDSEGVYIKYHSYSIGEHGGTHMDVPKHFNPNGDTLEAITLQDSIAPGVMIDCSKEVAKDSGYALTVQKIKDWEKTNGRIPNQAAVIINFDWSKNIDNHTAYLGNIRDPKKFKFPTISPEAGYWLADERDIRILAQDTPCADGLKEPYLVHVKFLRHSRRLLVENIRDPGRLPVSGFRLFAAPVKFVAGTGVQVRAFAIVGENSGTNVKNSLCLYLLLPCSLLLLRLWNNY